jgi:putative ABC transport system permease protein
LHTAVDPKSVVPSARNETRTLDPALPIYRVQAMDDLVGVSTADRRFTLLLYAAFAGLALMLATVGLYGLVSYAVSQRRSEIGLRMALGATASDVCRLVLREGLQPAVAGLLLGTAAAVFACRILRSQLFGVTPADPLTFAIVPLLLLAVATLACYLPAIRATRLDPTLALRAE